MMSIILLLLAEAPPRYLGGAAPTALSSPAPVDSTPSVRACSLETLRVSRACVFDAMPTTVEAAAAREKQAKTNLELASNLLVGLCRDRATVEPIEASTKVARVKACHAAVAAAVSPCGLGGEEALLDEEGRFSTRARACYESLAATLQTVEVPPQPATPPPPAPGRAEPKPTHKR